MVHIMSKKSATLPSRPEPPKVEDIVSDIESVEDNDVIFSAKLKKYLVNDVSEEDSGSPTDGVESGTSRQRQSSGSQRIVKSGRSSEPNVEVMYKQAVRFIELTDALSNAPGRLEEQCEHLQAAGTGLQKSIDELKKQARSALDASLQE